MKRFSILLFISLVLPAVASAQLQIQTHKEKISDFLQKSTKVVLTGNDSLDMPLRQALKDYWTISAYEFCTQEDFLATSGNSGYYFLTVADGGDGLRYWYLVKGGTGRKSPASMLSVAIVPICPSDGLTGREDSLLPILTCYLQNEAAKAIGSNFRASGVTYSSPRHSASLPLLVAENELSPSFGQRERDYCEAKGISIVSEEETVKAYYGGEEAAICYVVGPAHPQKGQMFYVLLADSITNSLYYIKRHKIGSSGCGLQMEDIKAFAKGRKRQ